MIGNGQGAAVRKPVPLDDALRQHLAAKLDERAPVTPPVTPPVMPPASVRKYARREIAGEAGSPVRQAGIFLSGSEPVLRDTLVVGHKQNVVAQDCGDVLLENVRSGAARSPDMPFQGQDFYADRCKGITIRRCAFWDAGWQRGMDAWQRSEYRHSNYLNFHTGPVTIEDSVYWRPSAFNLQGRSMTRGNVARRCFFFDAAIAVGLLHGGWLLDDCVVYDGHHHFAKDDKKDRRTWTANNFMQLYTDVTLRDVTVAGRRGQDKPDAGMPPLDGTYNTGCLVATAEHEHDGIKSPGPSLMVSGTCEIFGWPGEPLTGSGAASVKKAFDRIAVSEKTIDLDVSPWAAKLADPSADMADVSAQLRDVVRKAARAA